MTAIIIEDELPAQDKLEAMLHGLDNSIKILAKIISVKGALNWLSQNPAPDVAFVDIQLSDDHSFEIFRRHPIHFPVIFTTAYDKYLLASFEFNSIDYLLKPISEEKLKRSLEKLKKVEQHFMRNSLMKLIQTPADQPRVIGKKGTEFIALELDAVAYFFTEHKLVFARDFNGRQLIVDKSITELENIVKGKVFFRLNRKCIVQLKAIDRFKGENGKIKIFLVPAMHGNVFVSKETAPEFRKWIAGE